ncbi:DUF6843 domain-containing protein [Aquimarina algiphila]|uniref:DUF6843 domain-containing protein n=1 Tax=Aquimarina algiphila TaxID=2047982 RepID=UPI00248FDA7B|nr:hypothetical protein [Aquimarina algiphila]
MNQRTSNILFNIGIAFLILGGIGLTFMAFFTFIGLPIFIIGIILISLSKKKIKTKIIWIFSMITLVVLFWPIWIKINTEKPETYLIPENYSGKIIIVYGEDCGIEPLIENGRRVLEIPNNGILIIKPEFEGGIIDHKYYFVNKNKERTKIERYENDSDRTQHVPGIRLIGSGGIGGIMIDGSSSTESPLAIRYTEFEVYQDTLTDYNSKEEQKFNSLMKDIVNECRN